jgi:hypothetical protein
MASALMIAAGDVLEVQLTSETVVIETARGRVPVGEPGHISNRMRLFVKLTDGEEQKFDFEDTELGVRDGQRVAIVRAKPKRAPAPVNLMLFNLSSGERDIFEPAVATYLKRTSVLGPAWQAIGWSLLLAFVFWLVSDFVVRRGEGGMMSIFLAIMFAFLTYPLFWWLCSLWSRLSARMRYQAARKHLIADVEQKVAVFAPGATARA